MIIIFVLILLLFGAKKIPNLARGIGKSLGEFKKAKSDFESEFSLSKKAENKVKEEPARPVKPDGT